MRSRDPKHYYAVYPHAVWRVTDHRTGEGRAEPTGQGFVDRQITSAVPYGRMRPVRTFARRSDADKLASRLTLDLGLTGRESHETVLRAMKSRSRDPVESPKEAMRRADRAYMAMLIKQSRARWAALPESSRRARVRRLEDERAAALRGERDRRRKRSRRTRT